MPSEATHILPPPELELPRTLHDDRHRFEEVQVPIVTVSATFHQEIFEQLGERPRVFGEVVLSRAHYSMSVAVFEAARLQKLTAWLVDPTNYVSASDWRRIVFIERVAETTARVPILRRLKDFVDSFARGRLPLARAIETPLLYVSEHTTRPIISLHYEAGNILARAGRSVLQVVTDPHVRNNYLLEADRPNIIFAVFDNTTKEEFIRRGEKQGKKLDSDKVVVTGPPVDPRIVQARYGKAPINYRKRGLHLVLTTGGLGTNKGEIKEILEKLLPTVESQNISLILYAGTHRDFREMFYQMSEKLSSGAGDIDSGSRIRVIYDPSIIRANQELVEHAFSWADGFVTKPSGDMAYDAVAAGCFLLTLEPWGEWEENIEKLFTGLDIATKADTKDFAKQLARLDESGWIKKALQKSLGIDKLFLNGAKQIVDLEQKLPLK